jgi:putative Mg2+ transporter-C (MgtC) family protein
MLFRMGLAPERRNTFASHLTGRHAMPSLNDLQGIFTDPQVEGLFRVLLAGGLAALVGLEREMEGKPAGIRTYGLVGMGAAIFTDVGIVAFGPGDPGSRVAAQVITGIGFLGAGTILRMQLRVVGLTTAAGLWVAAAIGMAIGSGLYLLGIAAALLTAALLQVLRPEGLVRRQASVGAAAGTEPDRRSGGTSSDRPG